MGYKLLTQDMKTRKGCDNETDWSDVGEWHEATGKRSQGLCSDEYLHDYDDLLLAVLMNPAHAAIENPVCYETERDGDTETDGLKRGTRRLRLKRRIDLPAVTLEQCVRFGILCAKQVWKDKAWNEWADKWLGGENRSADAAAAYAAWADAAAWAAAAAHAAYAAADAAWAAAAAAHAACAAAAAAHAAYAAADVAHEFQFDFAAIAKDAVK